MSKFILQLENITKIYPNGFVANDKINMDVQRGEIHALLGENGAGKTTLMKVLFGIEGHEEGRVLLNGEPVVIKSPQHAIDMGIGMVHQHFMLVPSMTVAENLIIGIEPTTKYGLIDIAKSHSQITELANKFNFKINPDKKVSDLSVGQKQKVEIIKALLRGAKLLILDEPTAVLTPQETDELFVQLKKMREDGYTIVFITHKLDEVLEICDNFTVLRRGRSIHSGSIKDVTKQDISRLMVGRDVVLDIEKDVSIKKEVILKVRDMGKKDKEGNHILKNLNFTVRAGEILGIAGVEGNGQTELSEALTGMEPFQSGEVILNNKSLNNKSIREIRELGLAHISEDRMTYGVAQNLSVWENVVSDRYYQSAFNSGKGLKHKKIFELATKLRERYNIKASTIFDHVGLLSGGNIQKVVVAREFTSNCNFVVANQPTRGIDVGATEFIRNELIRLTREEDKGVLLISADLNEVLEVSDSLLVMVDGEFVAYIDDASTVNEYELGNYMLGVQKQTEEEIRRAYHD